MGKQLDTLSFIKKSKEKHEDKYDYSKSIYTNCRSEIIIICKVHKEFIVTASCHLSGYAGCPKCHEEKHQTTEGFIKKAIEVYNNSYDYSKAIYKADSYSIIICKLHGEFNRRPCTFLKGNNGCVQCAFALEWHKKVKEKHGDTYDYSKVVYIDCETNVIVICKIHGEFSITPHAHSRGIKCPSCNPRRAFTCEEWKFLANKMHNNLYDYSKVNYVNSQTKIIIICKKHGEFKQLAAPHLHGYNCPKCVGQNMTTADFILAAKKIHDNIYDYSKVIYAKSCLKVIIICKQHGDFLQTVNSHLRGHGCAQCVNKTESKLFTWLKIYFPDAQRQVNFDWCKSSITNRYLPFDFFIGELDCIIELDGLQHFQQVRNWHSPEYTNNRDVWKMQRANEQKISVVRILQPDVLKNNDIWLKNNLLSILTKSTLVKNNYISSSKHGDIYDNHKNACKNIVNFEINIDDFEELSSDDIFDNDQIIELDEIELDKLIKEELIEQKPKKKQKNR